MFLEGPGKELSQEKWRPYLHWARNLGPEDTVITFNYDRVIDLLAAHVREGNEQWRHKIEVHLPSEVPQFKQYPDDESWITPQGYDLRTSVLKLHGSVDWALTADKVERAGEQERFKKGKLIDKSRCAALYLPLDNIAMATPGPSKRMHCEDGGRFHALWKAAEIAIQRAHKVIFVGYQIPPSDALSRAELIRWLKLGRESELGEVHSVLGPDTNAPETRRLEGLVKTATNIDLKAQPMFAEDYLGLVHERA